MTVKKPNEKQKNSTYKSFCLIIDENKKIIDFSNGIDSLFKKDDLVIAGSFSELKPNFKELKEFNNCLQNVLSNDVLSKVNVTVKAKIFEASIFSFELNSNKQYYIVFNQVNNDSAFLYNDIHVAVARYKIIYNKFSEPFDFEYINVNDMYEKLFGLDQKFIIGKTIKQVNPDMNDFCEGGYKRNTENNQSSGSVYYCKNLSKHLYITSKLMESDIIECVFFDINDYIMSNNLILQRDARQDTILKKFDMIYFEVDFTNENVVFSGNFNDYYGYDFLKTLTQDKNEIKYIHDDDFSLYINAIEKIKNFKLDSSELEVRIYNVSLKKYICVEFCIQNIFDDIRNCKISTFLIRNLDCERDYKTIADSKSSWIQNIQQRFGIAYVKYDTINHRIEDSEGLSDLLGIKGHMTLDKIYSFVDERDRNNLRELIATIHSDGQSRTVTVRSNVYGNIKFFRLEIFKDIKENEFDYSNALVIDVTAYESQKLELEKTQTAFESVFNQAALPMFLIDNNGYITNGNSQFYKLTNYDKDLRISFKRFLGKEYESFLDSLNLYGEINNKVIKRKFNKKDNTYLTVNISSYQGLFNCKYHVTLMDSTEIVNAEREVRYLAEHDVLTGIQNRNYFELVMNNNSIGYPYALLLFDIDGLKLINDAFGHLKGDDCIKMFAKVLEDVFKKSKMISRIGGDEFAVILSDVDYKYIENKIAKVEELIDNINFFGVKFGASSGFEIIDGQDIDYNSGFAAAEGMLYRMKLSERSSRKSNSLNTIMDTLQNIAPTKYEHCERVSELAGKLYSYLGYEKGMDLYDIKLLGKIHDIGMITVSENILNKVDNLTNYDIIELKKHCESGFKIATNLVESEDFAQAVLCHHEHYDGSGYPRGLKGEKIPLYARVISVVDAYDSMVNGSIYKNRLTHNEALQELVDGKGTQFDPDIVNKFLKCFEE